MTPGLAAMTSRAGAAVPFARAAGLLEDLAGIRLTTKRVERSAEDGRARTREIKLGVFFTQDNLDGRGYPVRDRASSSYIASFEPASVFASLVQAEGVRRGADHVRQLTIIGDGAAWIWNLATATFPEATHIVDLYHARQHLHSLTRCLEFMLGDRRDEWLAARLEDLDHGDIDGIAAAVRKSPLEGVKKDEVDKELGYFLSNAPPHALQVVPLPRPVRRLRRRRGRLQVRHRPAPQAIRHALDRQGSRLRHRPALRPGQRAVGSRLPQPSQPDTSRLTSTAPKMTSATYKSHAHPLPSFRPGLSLVRDIVRSSSIEDLIEWRRGGARWRVARHRLRAGPGGCSGAGMSGWLTSRRAGRGMRRGRRHGS